MLFLFHSLLIYNGQFQKMSDLKSKLTKKGGQKIKMKVQKVEKKVRDGKTFMANFLSNETETICLIMTEEVSSNSNNVVISVISKYSMFL